MNKTAGFGDWLHTLKLKLYGWMSKNNIQAGDNTKLEKELNEYTAIKAKLKNYVHTNEVLNESARLTLEIAQNLKEIGEDVPKPNLSKIDNEIAQANEALLKIDEVLDFIVREIESRGLRINRLVDGRQYLVPKGKTISSRE